MKRLLALVLLCLPTASPAIAESCTPPAGGAVADYRAVFEICRDAQGVRLATRAMSLGGVRTLLTVDPQSLTTRLECAARLVCAPTDDEAQKTTRLRPPSATAFLAAAKIGAMKLPEW